MFRKIEKDLYISGIDSYIQYRIRDKIFTIAGEVHSLTRRKCKQEPSAPVESIIKTCPNIELLLEYPPSTPIEKKDIGSINIRQMLKVKEPRGVDVRRNFIDSNLLYSDRAYTIPQNNLLQMFWEPLVRNPLFDFTQSSYSKQNSDYLQKYANSKKGNIQWFFEKVLKEQSIKVNYVDFLREIWSDVADFYLLKIILEKGEKNHFVLIGQAHANNFYRIFQNQAFFVGVKPLLGLREDDCVNIKGSWLSC